MFDDRILASLRKNPLATCTAKRFVVDSKVYSNQTGGGPCGVKISKLSGDIYTLNVGAGSGDFYFPWVTSGKGGVGQCLVPRNSPDGTLVLTAPMSGCSLYVEEVGNNSLIFTHDADGKHYGSSSATGNIVCSVSYDDYATTQNWGAKMFNDKMSAAMKKGKTGSLKKNAGFGYALLSVRHDGKWKVFSTGVVSVVKHHAVPSGITPLLASF